MANPQLSSQLQHLWKASHALAATSPAVSAHLISTLYDLSFEKELTLADSTARQTCSACGSLMIPGWNTRVRSERQKKKKPVKGCKIEKNPTTPTAKRKAKSSMQGADDISKAGAEVSGNQRDEKVLRPAECFHIVYRCRICDRSTKQEIQSKTKQWRKQAQDLTSSAATPLSPSLSATSRRAEIPVTAAMMVDATVPIGKTMPPPPPAQRVQNASSKKRAKARKGNSLSELLAAKKKQDAGNTGDGGFGLDLMDLMKTG